VMRRKESILPNSYEGKYGADSPPTVVGDLVFCAYLSLTSQPRTAHAADAITTTIWRLGYHGCERLRGQEVKRYKTVISKTCRLLSDLSQLMQPWLH
jgi:hypothetical protein